jgi:NAD(P)-dependent dehydrogenase (short-subunit alcohol dehydrogenase family)
MNEHPLQGRVAAITGGGGVLCARMAEALAAAGAAVAVLDLRADAAEAVAGRLRAAGAKAVGVACNVLDRPAIEAAARTIEEKLGAPDLLVNGAGGNHPKGTTAREFLEAADLDLADGGSFFDLDPKGIEFVFHLNVLGTVLPSQVFARAMARAGRGGVINISSMNAFRPLTKIPAYSGAKAAVSNFTQWLAVHLARVGIRVNAIAPGFFVTDQNRALLVAPDGGCTPRGRTILAHTPAGRFGTPDDLTGTLLWLADDRASGFVTGAVIPVDGGFSAFSGV